MKSIAKYLSALLLLFCGGCDKSQQGAVYTPEAKDATAIHFIQSNVDKEFPKDATSGVIDLEIARTGNGGEYTVYLAKRGTNPELFDIPASVTIPEGEFSVIVPVAVDLEGFQMGASYKTEVVIAEREEYVDETSPEVSQYSDKVTLSASFELEWETFMRVDGQGQPSPQLATFNYSLYYTGWDSGLEVERAVGIADGTAIYRVKDWASGVMFRFMHDTRTNRCTVPPQSIGYFNSTYNEYVFVSDMAAYTGDQAAYGSYPCTFDERTRTFSFYLIYYVTPGYFAMGTETLVFESEPDTTPAVEISFMGIESTETGFRAPKLRFDPNDYVKSYIASVVPGDITKAGSQRIAEIRRQLIENSTGTGIPVLTLYDDNEQLWNVPAGNYTAVAVPYGDDDQPGALYAERFTSDPDGVYAPIVDMFEWINAENNTNYSPYTDMFWNMKVRNVASMTYLCLPTAIADYFMEGLGMTYEEMTVDLGTVVPAEVIEVMLSEEGRYGVFQGLDQGTSYRIGVHMTNRFGDTAFVSQEATTYGYFSEDFDRTKTMDDFLGAFMATATVETGTSTTTKSTVQYRIDISRLNDREVLITGTSDIRDFSPELRAFWDEDRHMLVVEPQSVGMYRSNYVMFGLYDGMSLYWGGNSLGIGYIGDTLHWSASPYSTDGVFGYMFLLFNSQYANGSTYLDDYVGSKKYMFVSMKPLSLAPAATSSSAVMERPTSRTLNIGDEQLTMQLMSAESLDAPRQAPVAKGSADTIKEISPKEKTMRTDLRLHSR